MHLLPHRVAEPIVYCPMPRIEFNSARAVASASSALWQCFSMITMYRASSMLPRGSSKPFAALNARETFANASVMLSHAAAGRTCSRSITEALSGICCASSNSRNATRSVLVTYFFLRSRESPPRARSIAPTVWRSSGSKYPERTRASRPRSSSSLLSDADASLFADLPSRNTATAEMAVTVVVSSAMNSERVAITTAHASHQTSHFNPGGQHCEKP